MRRLFLRLLTAVELTRLTMAFGAIGDLWFAVILARQPGYSVGQPAAAELPLALALAAAAAIAVGLFAFAASLNDLLDARHDVAFSPDRPIPAGRIRVGQATTVTVTALLAAIFASAVFGLPSLVVAAATASGILFFNSVGKYVPAVGLLAIGLVHAAHMLIPNPDLSFTLPLWLVATHAIAIATGIHRLEDKRPALTRRSVLGLALGYVLWSAAILGLGLSRAGIDGLWPAHASPLGLFWPLLAVVGFALAIRRKTAGLPGRVAAEKLRRYGAMWQSLYAAAWLLALGHLTPALWLGLLAVAGFAAMTAIKEINGVTGKPVAFRA